jgi:hypothetical protein
MTELPPLLRDQRKVDAEQLNLLAIFHFVCVGLALVGLMFLGLHCLAFMTFIVNAPLEKKGAPPEAFLLIFKVFYAIGATIFFAFGIANLLSGLYLRARKHRMFSLVVAACNCLQIPIGTILGAFTIIVLSRDSVRELYEAQARSLDSRRPVDHNSVYQNFAKE